MAEVVFNERDARFYIEIEVAVPDSGITLCLGGIGEDGECEIAGLALTRGEDDHHIATTQSSPVIDDAFYIHEPWRSVIFDVNPNEGLYTVYVDYQYLGGELDYLETATAFDRLTVGLADSGDPEASFDGLRIQTASCLHEIPAARSVVEGTRHMVRSEEPGLCAASFLTLDAGTNDGYWIGGTFEDLDIAGATFEVMGVTETESDGLSYFIVDSVSRQHESSTGIFNFLIASGDGSDNDRGWVDIEITHTNGGEVEASGRLLGSEHPIVVGYGEASGPCSAQFSTVNAGRKGLYDISLLSIGDDGLEQAFIIGSSGGGVGYWIGEDGFSRMFTETGDFAIFLIGPGDRTANSGRIDADFYRFP